MKSEPLSAVPLLAALARAARGDDHLAVQRQALERDVEGGRGAAALALGQRAALARVHDDDGEPRAGCPRAVAQLRERQVRALEVQQARGRVRGRVHEEHGVVPRALELGDAAGHLAEALAHDVRRGSSIRSARSARTPPSSTKSWRTRCASSSAKLSTASSGSPTFAPMATSRRTVSGARGRGGAAGAAGGARRVITDSGTLLQPQRAARGSRCRTRAGLGAARLRAQLREERGGLERARREDGEQQLGAGRRIQHHAARQEVALLSRRGARSVPLPKGWKTLALPRPSSSSTSRWPASARL